MTFDPTDASFLARGKQSTSAQPRPGHQPQPGPFQQQQFAPRPNPFTGIPLSDWVRDAGALLLLLVSLALPWTIASNGVESGGVVGATARGDVILITLLSVFSLSLTYLARASVFPPTVTTQKVWLFRLLANLPYFVLVVIYIVIDAARAGSISGLGSAAALGLAGALLAAQPRAAEVSGLGADRPIARISHRIALGYAVFVVLTVVGALVLGLLSMRDSAAPPLGVITLIVGVLFGAAAVLVPLVGILRGDATWLTIARALGAMTIGIVLFDAFTGFTLSFGGIETLRGGGYPFILLAGMLGLAASPALALTMKPQTSLTRWFGVASRSFVLIIAVATLNLLIVVSTLIVSGAGTSAAGLLIGDIVVLTAVIAVAALARRTLRSNPAGSQWLVLGLLGVIVVLGIVFVVLVTIGRSSDNVDGLLDLVLANDVYPPVPLFALVTYFAGSTWSLMLAFGLPLLAIVALTIPADVRAYYAQFGPVREHTVGEQPVGYQAAGYQPRGYQAAGYQAARDQRIATVQALLPAEAEPLVSARPGVETELGACTQPGVETKMLASAQPISLQPVFLQPTVQIEPYVPELYVPEPYITEPAPAPAPAPAMLAEQVVPVTIVVPEALVEAADPATPVERLFAIASENPQAWPQLAANPSTYPDLLQWLAQSTDPQVQQALRSRGL